MALGPLDRVTSKRFWRNSPTVLKNINRPFGWSPHPAHISGPQVPRRPARWASQCFRDTGEHLMEQQRMNEHGPNESQDHRDGERQNVNPAATSPAPNVTSHEVEVQVD